MKRNILFIALFAAAGCSGTAVKAVAIQTATIQRRDVIVTAEATGVIEPINVVEVKSKTASGQVIAMPIDIGFFVKPGDLIVQIDTTILHQNLIQATADNGSAQANLKVSQAQLARQQDLYRQHIITLDILEAAQTSNASATALATRQQANFELAKQSLIDAKVTATVVGTILTKPVSIGQVIQAGGGSVSGGTIIATMADLTRVRARALVAETDIGMVKPGQVVNVTVDAFPDHPFVGKVDHIEPSATVQQNVTMFATLIAMNNSDGLLQPGMNGEVSIIADTRLDVIAVPNDAIRSPREAAQAAALLGLNPDTVNAQMKIGGGGGGGGGQGQGGNGQKGGGRGGRQVNISNGELAADFLEQGGGQDGGQGGGRGAPRVQVTDEECKAIEATMKKKPAAAKKIDDLRAKMRDPGADRQKMMEDMKTAYAAVGVDMQKGGACVRRNGGGPNGGGANGGGANGGGAGGNRLSAQGGGGGGRGGAGGASGFGQGNGRSRPRTGLVFIQRGTTWEARTVRLGVANYDYTEVTDGGLKEGDKVAMLSAAALQAKRQAQNDQRKSGANPLGGGGGGRGPGRGN